jgi:hypothetical protein
MQTASCLLLAVMPCEALLPTKAALTRKSRVSDAFSRVGRAFSGKSITAPNQAKHHMAFYLLGLEASKGCAQST